MLNLQNLLASVARISEQAGQAIMAIYAQPEQWQLQHKEDKSPLTAADLASHHLIIEQLHALTPDIPVVSEESDEAPQRHTWSQLWLVDPLDGTKEFVARTGDFTVNIALVLNHRAVLGVLHAPDYGLTYMAAKGCGAWVLNHTGQTQRLSTVKQPSSPRLLVSRFHANGKKNQALLQHTQQCFGDYQVMEVGSALKMCRIAEGLADFYPRFGTTMEWDTAAGQIILEEAGGALVDTQGRPFLYNKRSSLANKDFIVVGDIAHTQDWLTCLLRC
ncbi:MAG: 3'(2'),5'-bisphosphate nucleotidase CysQ [Moraxellaceae bacterium]|nr:3'(2'),5'-bisphosphate nucleotidase CysQ [Moraxellaceae bacterium]MCP5177664.1 3'(2'),5'-bisphosphate nucleotidase CysQ [Moraxellaceae bacterium]